MLYRGTSDDYIKRDSQASQSSLRKNDPFNAALKDRSFSATYVSTTFTSASMELNQTFAFMVAGQQPITVYEIHMPKNTEALFCKSVSPWFQYEQEVLLPPGVRFGLSGEVQEQETAQLGLCRFQKLLTYRLDMYT